MEEDSRSYEEAIRSIDSKFWKETINDELESLMDNHTWIITNLTKGCKSLSSEWAFKKKLKADGSIDNFNTRLVIGGNNQKRDIDYFDAYSLVTTDATIRPLITLTSFHDLLIHQKNVASTFSDGDLEEKIYMR